MNRLVLLLTLLGVSSSCIAQQAPIVPITPPSPVDGYWLGTFRASSGPAMRLQITIKSNAAGQEFCTIDSLDLNSYGTPCTNVVFAGADLSFDVASPRETWKGELSQDGRHLSGTVTGTQTAVLNFTRQASRLMPPVPRPLDRLMFDRALPPVSAADMEAVLTKDLGQALQTGPLAPDTMGGISIGILRDGVRRVFAFGTAKPDSIFEIGSITKTFTGLVLAQMIVQGMVTLDEPVRILLPKDAVPAPAGPEITLLDLITHHSGLPRMPDNYHPADRSNPNLDYRPADLYSFLREHGVQKPANARYLYSNLGVGLLGQALANRAGMRYPDLVRRQILVPLGMHDTTVVLSSAQHARFIQGYDADHRPTHSWEYDALAGAGSIRSTATDMLTYLNANLHPEQLPGGATKTREGQTLPAALNQSHELRHDAAPGMRIAFAWRFIEQSQIYWHGGNTAGYSSYAFFNSNDNFAVIVLLNTAATRRGSFAEMVATHILQRFAGQPAISLSSAP